MDFENFNHVFDILLAINIGCIASKRIQKIINLNVLIEKEIKKFKDYEDRFIVEGSTFLNKICNENYTKLNVKVKATKGFCKSFDALYLIGALYCGFILFIIATKDYFSVNSNHLNIFYVNNFLFIVLFFYFGRSYWNSRLNKDVNPVYPIICFVIAILIYFCSPYVFIKLFPNVTKDCVIMYSVFIAMQPLLLNILRVWLRWCYFYIRLLPITILMRVALKYTEKKLKQTIKK